uniref:Reticulon-like protein n=2 Tax=Mesocestoides corti TaxID=53468 RepID=A0A5K3EVU8_MESCO
MNSVPAVPKDDIKFICSGMEKLPPKVVSLIYWKNPIESAIVMSTGFTLLFSIGYLSLISVFAYVCLTILCCTGAARVYYDLITSKKDDSAKPPFSDWFTKDPNVLRSRAHELVNEGIDKCENTIQRMRHYLLIENYIDSLKFALCMYLLSILGGFFNLITVVLIAFALLFSVPKLYDLYHVQIDKAMEKPKKAFNNVWSKLQKYSEKVPFLHKQKQN